jgi:hypothetical protein
MSLFLANSKLSSLSINLFAYLRHSFDPTEAAVSALAIGVALVLVLDIRAVRRAQEILMARLSMDQIFQDLPRDEAIARARRLVEDKAGAAGADRASITTVEVEDLPLAWISGNLLRTRVRVVGEIARQP